jgi:hypothetical protein
MVSDVVMVGLRWAMSASLGAREPVARNGAEDRMVRKKVKKGQK